MYSHDNTLTYIFSLFTVRTWLRNLSPKATGVVINGFKASAKLLRIAKALHRARGRFVGIDGFAFKAQAVVALEQAGFDSYDYGVLALLSEGARETQATIARALALDPSRLVALLDSLEARDLIARQRDPQDRRRHVVSITTAGKRQLVRLRTIARQLEDEFLAPLDTESREAFHGVLLRLAAHHDPCCCR